MIHIHNLELVHVSDRQSPLLNTSKFEFPMADMQVSQLSTIVEEHEERRQTRWLWVSVYTILVLLGQSVATLLGRFYYNKGGNTFLLTAFLETAGYPIVIPFAIYFSRNGKQTNEQPSKLILTSVYTVLGLFQAGCAVLYALGLQNLPVSTFSLVSTTQLGFNAFFSFVLNRQRFTPPIINALVLITISSALLIFQTDQSQNTTENLKRMHFVLGFSCTLAASALYSLSFSITELIFNKLLRNETVSTVVNVILYQSMVATTLVSAAMFITGEWSILRQEMENFEPGKEWYVIVLVAIAMSWQMFSIGATGLIFEVSSLFSNVIGAVGLPLVAILAVIFLHEKMDGNKAISILLAGWGFASYVYHHYPNDRNTANADENREEELRNFISQDPEG